MHKGFKIFTYFLLVALFVIIVLFILSPIKCEKNFRVFLEKGYCEFDLKTCDGIFACKKYNNEKVPCGGTANLCGEKVFCNCQYSFTNENFNEDIKVGEADSITVAGEFSCLPIKNQNEPHNDLCVYGIKTEDGAHYRLQLGDENAGIFSRLSGGEKIEISGTYMPEFVESYNIYDYLGVILVDSLKYLEF